MTTFTDVLSRRLRHDPGQPLVTCYDGEDRVELSVTTYANWVAKVAGLLEELDLERGASVHLDLPPHWLAPVFLGAAWTLGVRVTGAAEAADAVVCGPETLARWAPSAGSRAVVATALHPLGLRFPEPVPAHVHDLGVEVWGQPDGFVALDPPDGADVAHDLDGTPVTQQEMWEAAAGAGADGRLLSEANPASPPGLASVTEPLACGGSLVLVRRTGRDRLEEIALTERVTARFPA